MHTFLPLIFIKFMTNTTTKPAFGGFGTTKPLGTLGTAVKPADLNEE